LLFARAESKKWILFFDEADALFGKRTNVRDAHDKYANQEVSYLLQRIEDYDGLVILATNMKNNIDEAFIRRFNAILKFSAPGMEDRKKIWEKTFPEKVVYREMLPGGEDAATLKPFNIPEVVKTYELSGGNIVNIVHYAGIKGMKRQRLLEVGSEEPLTIYLPDVLDGIRHELTKSGIPFTMKNHHWVR
jgi:SpoVK/Ycf46/Vps4 family AAA+-type ATPase